jgi:hypothetical protein
LTIAGWEALGVLLLAGAYLSSPATWRQVSTFRVLALNVAFAAACVAGLILLVTKVNGLLTAVVGLLWAWSFLWYPNLLPLALSHGLLATAQLYWLQREDKWASIFGRGRALAGSA